MDRRASEIVSNHQKALPQPQIASHSRSEPGDLMSPAFPEMFLGQMFR